MRQAPANNYHSTRNPPDSLRISIEKFQLSYILGLIDTVIAIPMETSFPSRSNVSTKTEILEGNELICVHLVNLRYLETRKSIPRGVVKLRSEHLKRAISGNKV